MLFAIPADLPLTARFVIADQRAVVAGTESNDLTLALNGTVRFDYPTGVGKHNINLERSGPDCVQLAGPGAGSRGRILPADTQGAGWVVECRFPTPGIYHFGSDENGAVHGVVRVANADGSVPTENPPPTPTPDPPIPNAPPGSRDSGDTPPGTTVTPGKTALKWTAAKTQRKSLRIILTGGSERTNLTLEAQAKRTDLRAKGKAKLVRVARVTRTVNAGARVTVSVPLNAKAKSALRRLKKLNLTLRVTVAGKTTTQTVTLRAS